MCELLYSFRDRNRRKEKGTVGDSLLGVEAVQKLPVSTLRVQIKHDIQELNVRSLLSSETLEQNPGILVDSQVVHGAGIGSGSLATLLASDISKGRESVASESLHDCGIKGFREERRVERKRKKKGEREKGRLKMEKQG